MVDMKALTALHSSPRSAARVRARRQAEIRLKFYGIFAIALAALALVTLLSSVFSKAGDALTESYVTLPIDFTSSKINQDDPADGNYTGLMKDSLKDAFPNVKGRGDRRALYGLISAGAAYELQAHTISLFQNAASTDATAPSNGSFRFLLSDDADLYLKGFFGELRKSQGQGRLTLTGDYAKIGGEVTLTSTTPDFAQPLAAVKALLREDAKRLRDEAARQQNAQTVFANRAVAATDGEQRAELVTQSERYSRERDRLIAQADELERRAAADGGEETLSSQTSSVLIEVNGGWVRANRISPASITGEVYAPLTTNVAAAPGTWLIEIMDQPETARKVNDKQVVWIETLKRQGATETVFNWRFFTAGDSREAELAGIWGAVAGTFWTMLVTFLLAFPIGVSAAIYLEEFAPKNRFTSFVEVNINNLAAVPSIVFGLLGLAIFVGGVEFEIWGKTIEIGGFAPRSAPIAGGMVLALMTLPTIIIASRAAIRAVPPSIRDAALGVGASKQQATFHHVLPLAMPGVMTGSIIGMAQALGETAPLIMIGMVAFIVDIPAGVTDSATVLPVQIYRWSDFPERAFEAKTALAICVLLAFLLAMNILAIILRKRFERRW
ncbi:MAG: phosphate ABC transporter permease PstA [Pikeienuella sp.]